MPASVSVPGVYIEEIPSGVRTIPGVDTSITAFVGKAVRGPVGDPQTIRSFAEFEEVFGGLHRDFPLGYAVRDFFLNGGSAAIISRVYKPIAGEAERARIEIANLVLEASSEGRWGSSLRARVDKRAVSDPDAVAEASLLGVHPADLFDLTIHDGTTAFTEIFRGLTTRESARRADRVLASGSAFVNVAQALPSSSAPAAHAGALADADVWAADAKSTKAGGSSDGGAAGSAEFNAAVNVLEKADLFNLLCILPDQRGGDVPDDVYVEAMSLCAKRRAFLIVDSKSAWNNAVGAKTGVAHMNLTGDAARNAALYFPRIMQADPKLNGQIDTFPGCGVVAGVIARTDARRGVWKAPAGTEATVAGVDGLQVTLTDAENGVLNPLGINCLRRFPSGMVVWGARTLRGSDAAGDEYKYIPVRRTALFIEESLSRGLKWVVLEPNDDLLWSQIRLNAGAFMRSLFNQGAFKGSTPRDAYFVKCDAETTTQNDIDLGIVNITVGFAPLKPAEFVMIQLQLLAGQTKG